MVFGSMNCFSSHIIDVPVMEAQDVISSNFIKLSMNGEAIDLEKKRYILRGRILSNSEKTSISKHPSKFVKPEI